MSEVVVVTGIGGMGIACARRLGAGRAARRRRLRREEARRRERAGLAGRRLLRDRAAGRRVRPGSVGELARVDRRIARCPAHARAHGRALADAGERASGCSRSTCSAPTTCSTRSSTQVTDGHGRRVHREHGRLRGGAQPRARARARGRRRPTSCSTTLGPVDLDDFGGTYGIAKRINQLRVEQAAIPWGAAGRTRGEHQPRHHLHPDGPPGARGGRGRADAGDARPLARAAHRHRGGHRRRRSQWLASPAASFVSGCDLRVDGGVTAAIHGLGPIVSVAARRLTRAVTPTRSSPAACSRCRARPG